MERARVVVEDQRHEVPVPGPHGKVGCEAMTLILGARLEKSLPVDPLEGPLVVRRRGDAAPPVGEEDEPEPLLLFGAEVGPGDRAAQMQ